jgi:Phytanoyl-CoA dioxygenase (PhyH)
MATQLATSAVAAELEQNGIVVLPNLLRADQLLSMQRAFSLVLKRLRWNDFDGYEKTERHRHMVQNVLTLDQGFVDLALHPIVKEALREYVSPKVELVVAKGWLSLPTNEDFHGWHGDKWYDQTKVQGIPREVKLALYLTDVRSGAFCYVKGTHQKVHPRPYRTEEVRQLPPSKVMEVTGPAGTVVLFDTSGIHRQAMPILEPRHAVFLNYHDPSIPLQQEDVAYYRYHPLILNAAFLGDLGPEDYQILGFGNKTNYVRAYDRAPRHAGFHRGLTSLFNAKLRLDEFSHRVRARFRKMRGR